LNLDLTLNAQGDANAVFIFQIQGAFATNASSKIHLINWSIGLQWYFGK